MPPRARLLRRRTNDRVRHAQLRHHKQQTGERLCGENNAEISGRHPSGEQHLRDESEHERHGGPPKPDCHLAGDAMEQLPCGLGLAEDSKGPRRRQRCWRKRHRVAVSRASSHPDEVGVRGRYRAPARCIAPTRSRCGRSRVPRDPSRRALPGGGRDIRAVRQSRAHHE